MTKLVFNKISCILKNLYRMWVLQNLIKNIMWAKKTKIIATIWPVTESEDAIVSL
jgi:hypothetical protein